MKKVDKLIEEKGKTRLSKSRFEIRARAEDKVYSQESKVKNQKLNAVWLSERNSRKQRQSNFNLLIKLTAKLNRFPLYLRFRYNLTSKNIVA